MLTRNLPVPLTEAELLLKGQELAEQVEQYDEMAEHRKVMAKKMKDDLDELWDKILSTRIIIDRREENRLVPCYEVSNFINHTMETYRTDTGGLVSSRPLTESEREGELFPTKADIEST